LVAGRLLAYQVGLFPLEFVHVPPPPALAVDFSSQIHPSATSGFEILTARDVLVRTAHYGAT
jgi:hypothetical protein